MIQFFKLTNEPRYARFNQRHTLMQADPASKGTQLLHNGLIGAFDAQPKQMVCSIDQHLGEEVEGFGTLYTSDVNHPPLFHAIPGIAKEIVEVLNGDWVRHAQVSGSSRSRQLSTRSTLSNQYSSSVRQNPPSL